MIAFIETLEDDTCTPKPAKLNAWVYKTCATRGPVRPELHKPNPVGSCDVWLRPPSPSARPGQSSYGYSSYRRSHLAEGRARSLKALLLAKEVVASAAGVGGNRGGKNGGECLVQSRNQWPLAKGPQI